MNNENMYIWLESPKDSDGEPAWKALDDAMRKMATLTGFENDQNSYQKMKEMYQ
jgi:hypothetical protein